MTPRCRGQIGPGIAGRGIVADLEGGARADVALHQGDNGATEVLDMDHGNPRAGQARHRQQATAHHAKQRQGFVDGAVARGVDAEQVAEGGEDGRLVEDHPVGHPVAEGGAGKRVDDDYARTLRHAYFAAVSYVDAQVGTVLDQLERLKLTDNTIVVVWGDHGWHLGDHTIWGKHSTFERALRSTLIVRAPAMPDPGVPADGLVESLDLYPTLAELAGLEAPDDLTGVSFVPLLNDPAHPGKDGAFGYWHGRRTLRTDRYRLTRYDDGEPSIELFDLLTDPNETINVAAAHPDVVAQLLPKLEANRPSLRR